MIIVISICIILLSCVFPLIFNNIDNKRKILRDFDLDAVIPPSAFFTFFSSVKYNECYNKTKEVF
jgi:hypothetical protein